MAAGEGALRAPERQRTPAGSGGEQGAGVGVERRGGAQAAQGEGPPGSAGVSPGAAGVLRAPTPRGWARTTVSAGRSEAAPAAKSFKRFFSPVEPCVRSEQPICGRRDVRQQILIGESSR